MRYAINHEIHYYSDCVKLCIGLYIHYALVCIATHVISYVQQTIIINIGQNNLISQNSLKITSIIYEPSILH